MSTHQLLFLNAETPVHMGAGTGLGYIDNPIQREVPNEYPKAEATGIKGVIRQYLERVKAKEEVDRYLGKSDQKGSLQPSDGYLLLFPVITPRGMVAYLTCPFVLARLKRQLNQHGHSLPEWAKLTDPTVETVLISKDSVLLNAQTNRVVLQHRAFDSIQNAETNSLATWIAGKVYSPETDKFWHDWLKTRIVVVHDDVFKFFVKAHTEVRTGNKIDPKTGIVQTGLLFTTEYLPEGSVLYCWLEADSEFVTDNDKRFTAEQGLKFFTDNLSSPSVLQIGGKTSVGKGQIRLTYTSTHTKK